MRKNYYSAGPEIEDRPFNMAQLLMERLAQRMEDANQAASEGELIKWLKILRSIKSSIVFKLREKYEITDPKTKKTKTINEISDCNNALSKAKEALESLYKSQREVAEVFSLDSQEKLVKCEELLVMLMYEHGLYYPKSKNKSWEEIAEEEDI